MSSAPCSVKAAQGRVNRKRKTGHGWIVRKRHRPRLKPVEEATAPVESEFATIADLPVELLLIVLKHMLPLDYRQYRVLRCLPELRPLIDMRTIVVQSSKARSRALYKTPTGAWGGAITHLYEFADMVEDFLEDHRIRPGDLTVYYESTDGRLTKEAILLALSQGFHLNLMCPDGCFRGDIPTLNHKQVNKGRVVVYDGTTNGVDYAVMTRKYVSIKLLEFTKNMNIWVSDIKSFNELLDGHGVYWKSSVTKLKDLRINFDQPRVCEHSLQHPVFRNLKKLDLRRKERYRGHCGGITLKSLDLPNLTHFNLITGTIRRFKDNNLPSLKYLLIEEIDGKSREYGPSGSSCEVTNNHFSNLKSLSLALNDLSGLTFNGDIPHLKRFRIQLGELSIRGNLIPLIELFKHTQHLSLMSRRMEVYDADLVYKYITALIDPSKIKTLSINATESSPKTWMPLLQQRNLASLEVLRLYDLRYHELPALRAPKLDTIVLMGDPDEPNTINIRPYPKLQAIVVWKYIRSSYGGSVLEYRGNFPNTASSEPEVRATALAPDVRVMDEHYAWGSSGSYEPGMGRRVQMIDVGLLKNKAVVKLKYLEPMRIVDEFIPDPFVKFSHASWKRDGVPADSDVEEEDEGDDTAKKPADISQPYLAGVPIDPYFGAAY